MVNRETGLDPQVRVRLVKRKHINGILLSLLALLPIALILHSAVGGEKTSVVLLAVVLSAVTVIVGSLLIAFEYRTHRRVLPALGASIASVGIITSVATTHWPLRVTYALSRGSFEALAQRVDGDEHIITPLRAGFFTIQRAEISQDGIVSLWTNPSFGGPTGFVRCPPEHVPFNLWSIIRLDDRWQFIAED